MKTRLSKNIKTAIAITAIAYMCSWQVSASAYYHGESGRTTAGSSRIVDLSPLNNFINSHSSEIKAAVDQNLLPPLPANPPWSATSGAKCINYIWNSNNTLCFASVNLNGSVNIYEYADQGYDFKQQVFIGGMWNPSPIVLDTSLADLTFFKPIFASNGINVDGGLFLSPAEISYTGLGSTTLYSIAKSTDPLFNGNSFKSLATVGYVQNTENDVSSRVLSDIYLTDSAGNNYYVNIPAQLSVDNYYANSTYNGIRLGNDPLPWIPHESAYSSSNQLSGSHASAYNNTEISPFYASSQSANLGAEGSPSLLFSQLKNKNTGTYSTYFWFNDPLLTKKWHNFPIYSTDSRDNAKVSDVNIISSPVTRYDGTNFVINGITYTYNHLGTTANKAPWVQHAHYKKGIVSKISTKKGTTESEAASTYTDGKSSVCAADTGMIWAMNNLKWGTQPLGYTQSLPSKSYPWGTGSKVTSLAPEWTPNSTLAGVVAVSDNNNSIYYWQKNSTVNGSWLTYPISSTGDIHLNKVLANYNNSDVKLTSIYAENSKNQISFAYYNNGNSIKWITTAALPWTVSLRKDFLRVNGFNTNDTFNTKGIDFKSAFTAAGFSVNYPSASGSKTNNECIVWANPPKSSSFWNNNKNGITPSGQIFVYKTGSTNKNFNSGTSPKWQNFFAGSSVAWSGSKIVAGKVHWTDDAEFNGMVIITTPISADSNDAGRYHVYYLSPANGKSAAPEWSDAGKLPAGFTPEQINDFSFDSSTGDLVYISLIDNQNLNVNSTVYTYNTATSKWTESTAGSSYSTGKAIKISVESYSQTEGDAIYRITITNPAALTSKDMFVDGDNGFNYQISCNGTSSDYSGFKVKNNYSAYAFPLAGLNASTDSGLNASTDSSGLTITPRSVSFLWKGPISNGAAKSVTIDENAHTFDNTGVVTKTISLKKVIMNLPVFAPNINSNVTRVKIDQIKSLSNYKNGVSAVPFHVELYDNNILLPRTDSAYKTLSFYYKNNKNPNISYNLIGGNPDNVSSGYVAIIPAANMNIYNTSPKYGIKYADGKGNGKWFYYILGKDNTAASTNKITITASVMKMPTDSPSTTSSSFSIDDALINPESKIVYSPTYSTSTGTKDNIPSTIKMVTDGLINTGTNSIMVSNIYPKINKKTIFSPNYLLGNYAAMDNNGLSVILPQGLNAQTLEQREKLNSLKPGLSFSINQQTIPNHNLYIGNSYSIQNIIKLHTKTKTPNSSEYPITAASNITRNKTTYAYLFDRYGNYDSVTVSKSNSLGKFWNDTNQNQNKFMQIKLANNKLTPVLISSGIEAKYTDVTGIGSGVFMPPCTQKTTKTTTKTITTTTPSSAEFLTTLATGASLDTSSDIPKDPYGLQCNSSDFPTISITGTDLFKNKLFKNSLSFIDSFVSGTVSANVTTSAPQASYNMLDLVGYGKYNGFPHENNDNSIIKQWGVEYADSSYIKNICSYFKKNSSAAIFKISVDEILLYAENANASAEYVGKVKRSVNRSVRPDRTQSSYPDAEKFLYKYLDNPNHGSYALHFKLPANFNNK